MKTLTTAALVLLTGLAAHAQDAAVPLKWKRKMQSGLNVTGANFSDNWKAGGATSASWNALLNVRIDYNDPNIEWTNDLQTLFGNVKLKGEPVRKSADRLFFESKLSYKLTEVWRIFAATSFLSQFDAGYSYKKAIDGTDSIRRISNFLSPGYLTEAAGIEYKPVPWFSAQLGVVGLRQTFVTDQGLYDEAGKNRLYGVDKGTNHREQFIYQFVADFNKEILKNTNLAARYVLIGDYQKLSATGIVHRLDVNLVAKVNRYINVSLGGAMIYDNDQDKDVQYNQQLAIGILYTLQNFEEK